MTITAAAAITPFTCHKIAVEVARTEERRLQAEAEAATVRAALEREAADGFNERRARRKIIAGKSTHIANFLQRASVEAPAGAIRAVDTHLHHRHRASAKRASL